MLRLSFKQRLLTGFILMLLLVVVSATVSYISVKSLNKSYDWIDHTQQVIRTANLLELQLLNSEAALRGYVLTQKEDYRVPYDENINLILPSVDKLKSLLSDNPNQLKILDSVKHYAVTKVADMKKIVVIANFGNFPAARNQILTDKGQTFKNKFLKYNELLIDQEYILLKNRRETTNQKSNQTIAIVMLNSLIIFGLILFLLKYISTTFDKRRVIELQIRESNDELEKLSLKNENHNWLLSGKAKINDAMLGELTVDELSENIVTSICNLFQFPIGVFYLANRAEKTLKLRGAFAIDKQSLGKTIDFNEGLLGQAVTEREIKILTPVPDGYLKIKSELGQSNPKTIIYVPILFEGETIGALELGLVVEPKAEQLEFLNHISKDIGIILNSMVAKVKLRALFEQTQQQAEELTAQQEELRATNEDLMYKTHALQASEEELRVQQEELQQANSELEEKAQLLDEKNISIIEANEAIGIKAEQLEVSSKYKSEFLANMSHELRTPLNSILILAKILTENKPANLSEEQIKYAGVIHNAGADLLHLINDILDLSKIESGNVDLTIENVGLLNLKHNTTALFNEIAKEKGLNFEFNISEQVPKTILTDEVRLAQIIKNLLSNAFKFTKEEGSVKVEIGIANKADIKYSKTIMEDTLPPLYFAVTDTGIGIPPEKQQVIFEAFQQEDGSTSRKYGGTGLGLSISKELAALLGGEIQLKSEVGLGSTFTLFLPQQIKTESDLYPVDAEETIPLNAQEQITLAQKIIPNSNKSATTQTLLIIEDDENFAEILKAYAIEKGFSPIIAHSGDKGIELAESEIPDAIILDVKLPVVDGWTILKHLKTNVQTQHIPIHMMSAGDEKMTKAKKEGAIGFLKKPIEKEKLDEAFELLANQYAYVLNNVLVIEDQVLQSDNLTQKLVAKGSKVAQAYTANEAKELLKNAVYDCIILDLKLPDMSGFDLLDEIKADPKTKDIPVIINTAMELNREEMAHIMQHSQAMVLKNTKSNDRLLDEVSLFINKLKNNNNNPSIIHNEKPATENFAHSIEKGLRQKTVLITDDDMRNIFALSSALQGYEMNIIIANNGLQAIQKLAEHPEIDIILMDIMMPEMDGYEAIGKIRANQNFAKLPIIALTAKAMQNDRQKCIDVGASDYISKPIDVDKLLSLMRVWLS